ncbi:YeeE/YedE family protein [uncultured Ramlibacter sp.]|uniref:YeeE/YedE family protein n=1 Tax=uncultured Ramlibacter sp. TaxID=260755 RepID=UPI002634F84B|nr:YeeE/YedE family protein [uncultured Ramlibacter sp.]
MQFPLDPAAASQTVLWGALLLGLLLGALAQASRFCVRGAIADWALWGHPGRAVSWLLAVATGALGVQLLVSLQLFDAARALPWSPSLQWLSHLAGGLVFGYGMVLAAGCPQRNLVKAGSGSLRALVVLVVAAVTAAMTLRGLLALPRVNLLDAWTLSLGGSQDLGAIASRLSGLGAAPLRWLLALALAAAALALAWRQRATLNRWHWAGGIAVGLLVPAAYLLTGFIGFVPEHPETLEPAWLGTQSRRPEGLSFAAPLAHGLDLLTLWSDKSMAPTFGVLLALGVLLGSFASAKARGEFKLESFQSPRDMAAHLVGAVLMGFGGITAVGCSIGQGVTGLAMLSAGAVLTVAGIIAGALLALRSRIGHAVASASPLKNEALTPAK